jgi:hypothetical protein
MFGRVKRMRSRYSYRCDWTLRRMSTGAYTKNWVNTLSLHSRRMSALRSVCSVVSLKCKGKDDCGLLETQPTEPEVSDSERVVLRFRVLRSAACFQPLCDIISECQWHASFERSLHEMM